jgi:hypothetical protein
MGFNAAFYRAVDSEQVELCEFDGPYSLNLSEEPVIRNDIRAEMDIMDELAEEYLIVHGYLSETFQNKFFALRAQHSTYNAPPKNLTLHTVDASTDAPKGKAKRTSRPQR